MDPYRLPTMLDSAAYAGQVLETYSSPIALERPDALLFMHVGSERISAMKKSLGRIRQFLRIEGDPPHAGALMEMLVGDFGSGKSHLGYLIKHDCLTSMPSLLVSHVQITNEASWQATLAALLRSLRLSGTPSMVAADTEISAYRELLRWSGGNPQHLAAVARTALGALPAAAAADFARAVVPVGHAAPDVTPLLHFLSAWIIEAAPKQALQAFEMVLRTFALFQQQRLVLIVDEFEAIEAQEPRRQVEILQSLQDLFDDLSGRLPGLPATYLLLLSTPGWWEKSANLLPSMMGKGQRLRFATRIEGFSAADVASLVYRYVSLVQLNHERARPLAMAEIQSVIDEVLQEHSTCLHQLRALHSAIRGKVEARCLAT